MDKNFLLNEIRKVIIQTVHGTAEKIFLVSQINVPEKSGNLKKSGSFDLIENGATIQYLAPYAALTDRGRKKDIPIKGVQTVFIKEYKRRSYIRKDGVRVEETIIPAHKIVYQNKRLIPIKTDKGLIFRVISKLKARPGTFFFTNAVRGGFNSFVSDLNRNLKARFE